MVRIRLIGVLFVFHLLIAVPFPASAVPTENSFDQAYAQAVGEARGLSLGVTTRLTPVSVNNPDLVWENDVSGSRVLMASMISRWVYDNVYAGTEGQEITMPNDVLSWVTVVPKLKNFDVGPDAEMRYKQLLGLNPNWSYGKVIEIWVRPEDMFRPTPDPEVDDSTAEPDFSDTPPTSPRPVNSDGEARPYYEWFNYRKAHSYTGADAVPWSRAGYTWDWGRDGTVVGLSEFVVLQGSTVGVHSITDIEDYHSGSPAGCMFNPDEDFGPECLIFFFVGIMVRFIRRRTRDEA